MPKGTANAVLCQCPRRNCLLRAYQREREDALASAEVGLNSKQAVLVAARDGAVLTSLWQCVRRHHDICNTQWEQVYCSTDGTLAATFWQAGGGVPEKLLFSPSQTKTRQDSRPYTIVLEREPEVNTEMCAIRWLKQYYETQAAMLGRGPSRGPIFRAKHGATSVTVLTTPAMNKRLRTVLERLGQYAGETIHGMRRALAQACAENGDSQAEIMQRADITTPSIVARYCDIGRHLP